ERVKAEILQRLDITPEKHRQAFRGNKTKGEKSPKMLWHSLRDEMMKWLRPAETTKEEICDQVLLEQFLMDLEDDTQQWVRCHGPTTSLQALQLAEQYTAAQAGWRPGSPGLCCVQHPLQDPCCTWHPLQTSWIV
uniref:SCAN box domain-containing protein n=1 Tax=Crocodylus porosus TaxID=8502 RepID=A0A7M4E7Q3_CROPO